MFKLAALCAVALATSTASHAGVLFTASLTNSQEVSPAVPTLTNGAPRPASFGSATFQLNDAQTALTFQSTISNIDFTGTQTADPNDNLLNAHIHASATSGFGVNAPVVWGFIGSPFNDVNPNDVVVTPFATGVGATVSGKWDFNEGNGGTTLLLQLPNLLAGRAYMNFHTVQFAGGEIRGQILPVAEPATAVLALAGLAAIGVARRSRRA